jgi:hypothetical protein
MALLLFVAGQSIGSNLLETYTRLVARAPPAYGYVMANMEVHAKEIQFFNEANR